MSVGRGRCARVGAIKKEFLPRFSRHPQEEAASSSCSSSYSSSCSSPELMTGRQNSGRADGGGGKQIPGVDHRDPIPGRPLRLDGDGDAR